MLKYTPIYKGVMGMTPALAKRNENAIRYIKRQRKITFCVSDEWIIAGAILLIAAAIYFC